MVSYATEVKRHVLGVTAERVVSAGVPCRWPSVPGPAGVDWALSTTGVAGPDRQEGQAVGTVTSGWPARRGRSELALEGDRAAIRRAACAGALDLLLAELSVDELTAIADASTRGRRRVHRARNAAAQDCGDKALAARSRS